MTFTYYTCAEYVELPAHYSGQCAFEVKSAFVLSHVSVAAYHAWVVLHKELKPALQVCCICGGRLKLHPCTQRSTAQHTAGQGKAVMTGQAKAGSACHAGLL